LRPGNKNAEEYNNNNTDGLFHIPFSDIMQEKKKDTTSR